jgi:hypothetical protein
MEPKVKLRIDLAIGMGRGYRPAEENKTSSAPVGTIFIDSIFTPIRNVKFSVENFRVEQKTDYEKLILEIQGDGSITPKNALQEAAKILIHHFMLFSDERITLETEIKREVEEFKAKEAAAKQKSLDGLNKERTGILGEMDSLRGRTNGQDINFDDYARMGGMIGSQRVGMNVSDRESQIAAGMKTLTEELRKNTDAIRDANAGGG